MSDTVCVIGLGYVGLPTAALLAAHDMRVVGVDIDAERVARVNRGDPCIAEPGLDALLAEVVRTGALRATAVPEPADIFLIAVPTPLRPAAPGMDPKPDLSHLRAAAMAIAPVLRAGNRVILESTMPVGTTAQLSAWLGRARPDLRLPHVAGEDANIAIAYCPERVLPGRVMHELVHNERVVGGITPACAEQAAHFYARFVQGKALLTDARTAELCKLAENSFRDVNIAFANELSMICDAQDIDVSALIRLANRHPRVNILQPGCGVGGHCLAIDPWFIIDGIPELTRLIRTARRVNDDKPRWLLDKIDETIASLREECDEHEDIRIACFGLTYKPDVGDIRESPALHIAETLAIRYGKNLGVVEPYLSVLPSTLIKAGAIQMEMDKAVTWAHVLLVLVDHTPFRCVHIAPTGLQRLIDVRGIWRENQWSQ